MKYRIHCDLNITKFRPRNKIVLQIHVSRNIQEHLRREVLFYKIEKDVDCSRKMFILKDVLALFITPKFYSHAYEQYA